MKAEIIYGSEIFYQKLRKRNKEAFQVLYEEFKLPLYHLIYSMTRDREKTADIIQETFIRAIKKIHQLQDEQKLKYWLFRIAINQTLNVINKEKRVSLAGDELEMISDRQVMEQSVVRGRNGDDRDEQREWVLALVELLPAKQRMVFNLKYIDNFKEQEIAEIVDIPVGTVKSRLNIARNRLREWLEQGEKK